RRARPRAAAGQRRALAEHLCNPRLLAGRDRVGFPFGTRGARREEEREADAGGALHPLVRVLERGLHQRQELGILARKDLLARAGVSADQLVERAAAVAERVLDLAEPEVQEGVADGALAVKSLVDCPS